MTCKKLIGLGSVFLVAVFLFAISGAFPAELPQTSSPLWKAGFAAVQKTLRENLRAPDSLVPHYHAQPAPAYKNVYLWDSAFIALVWLKEDPKIAEDIIRSVLYFEGPDGRISHIAEHYATDPWSNPPVLAWAADRIARESGDKAFAAEVYPKLKAFHDWYWRARRLKSGLFYWLHAYESGVDNSPRFGARDESSFVDTTRIGAVDFTSYAAIDSLALVDLAEMRNPTPALEKEMRSLREQAREAQTLIREKLWDEETGYFYDRDESTGQFNKIPTIASFFPLLAGAPTSHQKELLLAHLRNEKEFDTHIPFPSVSHADPHFEKDCWRGPVWINTAYLVIAGLDASGEHALASELARKLVQGVYATWEKTGKIVEFYDPDREDFTELSRKRGTGLFGFFSASTDPVKFFRHLIMKQLILGRKPVDHFVGWTGLVNNLALDYPAPLN